MFLFEDSLGVDIRSDYLYAVLIGKSVSQFHLLDSIAIPLNEKEEEKRAEIVASSLHDFISRNNFKNGAIQIAIPRKFALIRFFNLPNLPREDINRFIKFEAERHVPGNLEEYFYDTHVVDEKISSGMKVLFVAVQRKAVLIYLDALRKKNISPDLLDISSFSALNALYFKNSINGVGETSLFIQPGGEETELTLVKDGRIRLTRSIKLSLPFESTNNRGDWNDEGEEPVFIETSQDREAIYKSYINHLITDVQDSLALSGISAEGTNSINRIVLPKASIISEELKSNMEHELNIPTVVVEPLSSFISKDTSTELTDAHDFTTAVGLALRSYNQTRIAFNFLPKTMRLHRKRYGLWISITLSIFISLSLLSCFGLSLYRNSIRQQKLQQMIAKLQPELEQVIDLKGEIKKNKELFKNFSELGLRKSLQLEVLSDLTSRINTEFWLNYIFFEADRLTIHGIGNSPETLVQVLDESKYLDGVKLERVINDRFTIVSTVVNPSESISNDENGDENKADDKSSETMKSKNEIENNDKGKSLVEKEKINIPISNNIEKDNASKLKALHRLSGKSENQTVFENKPDAKNRKTVNNHSKSKLKVIDKSMDKPVNSRKNVHNRGMD